MRKLPLAWTVVLGAALRSAAAAEIPANVYESPEPARPAGRLDEIVFAKLSTLGVQPVLCSDAVFVRRAYLDLIGKLPTAQEAREFIENPTKGKRRELVDGLLERDEYADYWAMRWGDILRIKAEFPVNLWPNAAQAYHRWVRASIAENKPYDKFTRELLTSSGSNFRVGPVNFYRAVQNRTAEGIAMAVALALMGSRADGWPEERLQGMAVFFSQIGYKPTGEWKEEIVFWDPLRASATAGNTAPGRDAIGAVAQPAGAALESPALPPAAGGPKMAMFPDGTRIELPADRDPREVFADWLITPENPWLAKSIVNRVWAWLLGRGIIHEPDDIRADNPPSNPQLLAYLEEELVAGGYDLKQLCRLVVNSSTYQFSSVPRTSDPEALANFAVYPLRRLDAEVLIDAVNQVTGTSDLYTSAIPEPFTYIPRDMPAVAIADGSITSPFLALFGRPARATGMENERDNKPVPAQWLQMLNSSHIQNKLERGPNLRGIIASGRGPRRILEELYLTILSRKPSGEEIAAALAYGSAGEVNRPAGSARSVGEGRGSRFVGGRTRENWIDIAWALINSAEFLYRH
ncbi:MAG: DUF1553 domain-containing protein [Pirellulales bacterium]|jgi:hypothetical protein|nr:DUF1553 domain-containing protein [Thermoguttaceae bacterium]MDD4785601.1 DUF1553 domain-containing protein [Pirellulales bacterium]NLZ02082.1 DUF1553 domain-containing protein [Pirellulaceae bacterium]